ncbi:MAG: TetR/AcrR family transcriptional regulator, partial [Actinomycetota bacterium]
EETSPKQRLIDAADVLMYERGYESVGVADLCRAADVRKGSFYHFFPSKQALALAMLDRSWQRVRSTIFAASIDDPDVSVFDGIEAYGQLLADNLERISPDGRTILGCRFGNFAVELSARDAEVRARVDAIFAEMTAAIASSFVRGLESGEVDDEVDPERAALDVLAHMEGLMVLAKSRRDPDLLRGLGAAARRLVG